jgi:hypothetical protein
MTSMSDDGGIISSIEVESKELPTIPSTPSQSIESMAMLEKDKPSLVVIQPSGANLVCPSCGLSNPPGERYCQSCGSTLSS